MSVTLASLQSDAMTALRTFLLAVLPSGVEVVAGQANRVPEPQSDDYVLITPLMRPRLSTNTIAFVNTGTIIPSTNPPQYSAGQRISTQATNFVVQCDIHGPNSGDNCQIIATMFRDRYACESMAAANVTIAPLYASDPRQTPYIDSEDQYEERWSIDLNMQVNPSVTAPIQFATSLGPATLYKIAPD
jgi:hypothetical protein